MTNSARLNQLHGADDLRLFMREPFGKHIMAIKPVRATLPDPWPFDQSPDCAVFTTRHIIQEGAPITHVFHDADDHGWQFHYPGEKSVDDLMIVALQNIAAIDPSVCDVADLPPGWMAYRSEVGAEWHRMRNEREEQ